MWSVNGHGYYQEKFLFRTSFLQRRFVLVLTVQGRPRCHLQQLLQQKAMLSDPRAEPRYAERVPYVVIHGEPGARLVDMVINPYGLLEVGSPYRLNELYYITKQIIPALQRVFGLLGVNLNKWFKEMPRPTRSTLAKRQSALGHGSRDSSSIRLGWNKKPSAKVARIDTYYMSSHCTICGDTVQGSEIFCSHCLKNEAVVATVVAGRTSKLEREIQHLAAVSSYILLLFEFPTGK